MQYSGDLATLSQHVTQITLFFRKLVDKHVNIDHVKDFFLKLSCAANTVIVMLVSNFENMEVSRPLRHNPKMLHISPATAF